MRNAYSYAPYRDQIEARDRARWLGGTASANVKPKHQNDAIASPDHQDKPEVLLVNSNQRAGVPYPLTAGIDAPPSLRSC